MSKAIVAAFALVLLTAFSVAPARAQMPGWGGWFYFNNWQPFYTSGNVTPGGLANRGTYLPFSDQLLGNGPWGGYGYYNQFGEYKFDFPLMGNPGSNALPGYATLGGSIFY